MKRSIASLFSMCWCFSLLLVSQAAAIETEKFSGTTMGPIQFNVTVVDRPDDVTQAQVKGVISEALGDVNQRMSTYLSDSEVSRFNASRSSEWFEVSEATAVVVKRSLEISEVTDGAFDITVGPLVSLWKFGPTPSTSEIPSQAEVASTLERVGYRMLEVRLAPPALRKTNPDIEIDLSAIAKGYAVDRVAEELETLGIERYLVEVGGEVRANGTNPSGKAWTIAIEKPVDGRREQSALVSLSGQALATSGDYRTFYEVDGKRYSHEIDPKKGKPVEHDLASVSIVAKDCMTADALATAGMVLGHEQLESLVDQPSSSAFWIRRQGDKFEYEHTESFPVTRVIEAQQEAGNGASWLPMVAAALIVFALAVIGMSVGVIFSNREIKGSCGGLAALKEGDLSSPCEICEARTNCEEYQAKKEDVACESEGSC